MQLPEELTPAILDANPSLITHKCQPGFIHSFDGFVGSVVQEGHFIVTSPNAARICQPPLGGDRSIYLRTNLRYGEDDPLQWPQPFFENLPHYACIPACPDRRNHPHMILWMTPTQRDYVPLPGPIAGLGTLHSAPYSELIKVAQEVLDRVSAGTLRDRALIVWRVPPLRLLLQRLEYVPTTLRRVQLGVREAQRYILELIAAADWYEKYEPRLKLPAPPSWSMVPARTIGAFTNNLTDCDSLFRMGLPVWLIRPWEALPSIRVQKTLDTIEHKALYPEEPASRPSHRAIFIGAATDPRKYSAIYDFSVSHFLYADPFGTVRAPPAALAPAVVSQTEKALQREIKRQAYSPYAQNKKGKGPAQPQAGRNKFEDPVNPIYPPAIPSWSLALLNVQQGTTRFKPGTSNETDTGYVFPEPAGFIALDSDDRRRSFFRSWLKLRPLLIFRMSSEDFEQAKPMKAQAWRELLGLDFLNNRPDPPSTPGSSSSSKPNKSHGKKSRSNDQAGPSSTPGQSKSQRLRAMMAKFLEGCLDAADTDLREEVESNAVSWNGADFDAMESRHFEEVLWELAELNFRFELAALDARMSASTVTERRHLVAQCFPDVKREGSLLVVKLECADQGLGSLHWEQRARYLHALKCLMMTWKAGAVPEIIKQDSKILWKAAELDVLEEEITKLYTQEFYDHFRRAPIVPRRLSHAARTVPLLPQAGEPRVLDPRPLIYYDLSMFVPRN